VAGVGSPVVGVRFRVEADDWRAAVRAACGPLVEGSAVEPRYPEHCIETVEEHGPYVVLAPGLALAHARPEDGVLRLGLAVAVLTEAVPFGHPENDPVDLVFAFGSPDKDRHVGLLSALASRLSNGLAAELRAAGDVGEAEALLSGVTDEVR
jgi:PTS system ascorbate-specific IIA component